MNDSQKLTVLQNIYVTVLADTVLQMGKQNVLKKVTEEKKAAQIKSGKMMTERFNLKKPEEVFLFFTEIFNCAKWEVYESNEKIIAECKNCKLCAMAKNLKAESPCDIYCLNPIEGMIKNINKDLSFDIKSTLWESNKCLVKIG